MARKCSTLERTARVPAIVAGDRAGADRPGAGDRAAGIAPKEATAPSW